MSTFLAFKIGKIISVLNIPPPLLVYLRQRGDIFSIISIDQRKPFDHHETERKSFYLIYLQSTCGNVRNKGVGGVGGVGTNEQKTKLFNHYLKPMFD